MSADRASAGSHAVVGLEVAQRVVLPQHLAVPGGVRTQHPVLASGEHHAGNDGRGPEYARGAGWGLGVRAVRRSGVGRVPRALAAVRPQRGQAAGPFRERNGAVVQGSVARRAHARALGKLRGVHCLGHPEDGAAVVRIQGRDAAALLAGDQHVPPARQGDQDRRSRHVVVRAARMAGAVEAGHLFRHVEQPAVLVAGEELGGPETPAGIQIERDHRVARPSVGHVDVAVPRADVDRPAPQVEDRGGPHAGAGGSVLLDAQPVLADRPGPLGNGVALPDLRSVGGVEDHHGALRGAALVLPVREPGGLLQRPHGHIEALAAGLEHRRSRDLGHGVIVHAHAPQPLPAVGVHGVDVRPPVPEVDGVALRPGDRPDAHRGYDRRPGIEGPVDAAGPGVESVDEAVVAAQVQAPSDHDGLGPHPAAARQAEGPLEREARNVVGRQSGVLARLEPGAGGRIGILAVPLRGGEAGVRRHVAQAGVRHGGGAAVHGVAERPARHVGGEAPLLLVAELRGGPRHAPPGQRFVHAFGRECSQGLETRRPGHRAVDPVTGRAALLEQHEVAHVGHARLRPGRDGDEHQDGRDEDCGKQPSSH